ncbi:DUF411 domain-containing protein [Pseudoponticoccus marisrubri]|uniref:Metal-binding protein n=1 Tax=Pseudoponticoccus marisrubri TaxID=1685382 RepID=A0A0W7WIA4_9RHOB|nr:DUF411 domain-containing protein [Pseudoponticoccus marisrubri]KUF10338.1 metal-binding protein [Pseudoponticoccus marisrubri]
MTLTRRKLLACAAGFAATMPAAMPAVVQARTGPAVHVLKDPDCGCCAAWIDILRRDGFAVTSAPSSPARLMRHKRASGIPANMVSCHTGQVAGYMIEGHVPAADIRRLLAERPDAVGLAVPGMPYGSPGMGPETAREAYDVFLIRRDGRAEVFNRYPAA